MNIQKSIVAVLDRKKNIVGTGFLAGENLILTCAHVVEGATAGLNDYVAIRFMADRSETTARVESKYFSSSQEWDVSVLHVEGVPQGVTPLPLGNAAGSAGNEFYAYGYAIVTNVQGIGARGKIIDIIDQGHLVQLTSQEPDHGMSGGPVLDESRQVIIGMVTKGKGLPGKDQSLRNTQTTFATSVEVLRSVCPKLPLVTPKHKRHKKKHSNPSITVGGKVEQAVLLAGNNNVVNVNFPPNRNVKDNLASRAYPSSIGLIRPNIYNYLRRSRLTDRLNSILSQSSLLIRADAGFGKTWLIKDFVDTISKEYTITWYSFPKYGSEMLDFILDLATDLFAQTNQVGAKTIQFSREREFDTESIARPTDSLATLLGEIAASPSRSFILILEDIHNINDEGAYTTIISLLQSRPQNLRVLLTSRTQLPFGQAKLIAQGYLSILERADIGFSLE